MLMESRLRRPHVTAVVCDSWMCSLPRFLELFPASWATSATPRPELRAGLGGNAVTGGSGWWGQFTTRAGGFHGRNAASFRATGDFPYPPVACRASLADIVAHLRARAPSLDADNVAT